MVLNLTLYGNRPVTSPYVMTVFVALEEKGLPFEFLKLDLEKGEHLESGYVDRSITHRVPTLLCDGKYFSESSAITEFLEERFPAPQFPSVYPTDIVERARVRMVQALIRSDFMPLRVERATDTVFQNAPILPLSALAEASQNKLERVALSLVGDGRHFVASEFSLADVDLSTMLQRLCANGDPMPQMLCDYANRVWTRPSIRKWLSLTNYQPRV